MNLFDKVRQALAGSFVIETFSIYSHLNTRGMIHTHHWRELKAPVIDHDKEIYIPGKYRVYPKKQEDDNRGTS